MYIILNQIQNQRKYRFISSSLLFLYDASTVHDVPMPKITIIDFTHVMYDDNDDDKGKKKNIENTTYHDIGFITGIQNLIHIVDDVLQHDKDVMMQ